MRRIAIQKGARSMNTLVDGRARTDIYVELERRKGGVARARSAGLRGAGVAREPQAIRNVDSTGKNEH